MDIRLKETPFEFGGKRFLLRCNMNVLADVQEAFGGEIIKALSDKSTLKSIFAFLSAMLNDYADEQGWAERYTAREVGRALATSELSHVTEIVMELVSDAMKPENTEEAEKN